MSDHSEFVLHGFRLQSGVVLPKLVLAYRTYGELNGARDNVVVLPTFYTGSHIRNEGYFGPGRTVDPERHFIVSVNLIGNGYSSSPSNTPSPFAGSHFPVVTLYDNVRAQYALVTSHLGARSIALVTGWSMAGCQSFQWAAQFPELVRAIVPYCASARTSVHNRVFLEGVKAALEADCRFDEGNYLESPVEGLKAFGRVYAGWAYSQTFFREGMYRKLGFETAEELLLDWESDHLNWDANDLLSKLDTWQRGDISDNELYHKDLGRALSSITARTIIISCSDDLYFRPEDNELEVAHIPHGRHDCYRSPWGHCVASGRNDPDFHDYLDSRIREVLD
ncbi:MAG: alpha/beta fold hydrolase [Gammaproteobacteria bacterium]|nr:alpha/beta fold hydrolase [Gammaproteobacteria bacterium]MYJ53186.1 alpha/beta fold hydrolase [Gammaproteobacteria bacterium]